MRIRITGVTPLLMHSTRGMSPTDSLALRQKELSKKRNKTDQDHLEMNRLDAMLGLYWDDLACGVYLPGTNIEAAIRDGAKRSKLGKAVTQAVNVLDMRIPLDVGRTFSKIDDVVDSPEYVFETTVKVGQARVLRCRPKFDRWSCVVDLTVNDEVMNERDVLNAAQVAGRIMGIGDFRPRFGRFNVEEVAA
jgi:hypothetical protein